MISLIEARHFRCLRYVSQPMGEFQVLVGPNASGKTTFLDVVAFLGSLVAHGLDYAVDERAINFHELLWNQNGNDFELAIEARIPEHLRILLPDAVKKFNNIRYEIRIGVDNQNTPTAIQEENVVFVGVNEREQPRQLELFPSPPPPPPSLFIDRKSGGTSRPVTIIRKIPHGNDNFYAETYKERAKGWVPSYKLGPKKSALGNMPAEDEKFPVSSWLRNLLVEGVQPFMLNSLAIREPSPPYQTRAFKTDGSNLPWIIQSMKEKEPEPFKEWIGHIQTALPEIESIETVDRPEDRHCYLVIQYRGGLKIPSWMASDGTLRLLALTLPAYLPNFSGVYLIEEPENGIHPRAVETVYQSLSSVYGAQILVATHSPIILSMVKASQVLCFAKNEEGATDIVPGNQHPALSNWQGEVDLGTLFAAGVLG